MNTLFLRFRRATPLFAVTALPIIAATAHAEPAPAPVTSEPATPPTTSAEAPSAPSPASSTTASAPTPQDPVTDTAASAPAPQDPTDTAAVAAPEATARVSPVAAQAPPVEEPEPEVRLSAAPGDGVTLKGESFSLNVKSRFQLRHQLDVPPKPETGERELSQSVNINTLRLWLSGHAYRPEFKYSLQFAFAGKDYRDGAVSPVYDAYVDYKAHRDFDVRAGQFFVPFDRLRTVREWALQMAERPRPVAELTLDRDVGVAFYSDHFLDDESPLAYRVGVFGGGGTNLTTGKEPGALLVARLELRPLGDLDDDVEGDLARRDKPGLAVGAGIAQDFNTNRQRTTTGPTFAGGTTDATHAAVDLVFKWMGFALEGEWLWKKSAEDAIESVDDDGAPVTEFTRSGAGWVVQASYVADPPIEVVGRLARLTAASGTDPAFVTEADDRGQELGAGINYYLNGHRLKLQTTWIARTNPDFDFGEASHGFSTQLDATF